MTSHEENPDFTAKSSYSCLVLSFPPGFTVSMSKSCSQTMFDVTLLSGMSGRIDSTMITFPQLGRALQQFLRSVKQCSSLQSWSIHCKFHQQSQHNNRDKNIWSFMRPNYIHLGLNETKTTAYSLHQRKKEFHLQLLPMYISGENISGHIHGHGL